ncbi:MAG: ATP-binding protein, partial [Pseudomonadota bacterium]|nr:ATP-binding protein [Pseudomonadota bacterium]
VGVHTDVTELRALEQERASLMEGERVARLEVERANRVKDEFLATLSHELRTPLSISLGWSRLLLKKHGMLNEEISKGLKIIVNSTFAQSQIISDLLDISSISSGKTMLTLQPVDLNDLIVQCVAAQEVSATEKNISLKLEQKNEPKVVLGDPNRLHQVMGNLLTNALKFTPSGGQVAVEVNRVENSYEISIQDTGEGIGADFLPHIFDRFRQADGSSARNHGGLGLGLAIVKQLIDMHGGEARAESPGRGQGARFTVSLPVQGNALQQEDVAKSGRWPVHAKIYEPDSFRGIRALIVEDEPSMREFVIRILEEHGALTVAVGNGVEALLALKAVAGASFNILICDIGLPGMDGYELIGRIRNELLLSEAALPAVAVTAFARDGDRRQALAAGFQGHLPKPFEAIQIAAEVARFARIS